jgi:hypothetical protein
MNGDSGFDQRKRWQEVIVIEGVDLKERLRMRTLRDEQLMD